MVPEKSLLDDGVNMEVNDDALLGGGFWASVEIDRVIDPSNPQQESPKSISVGISRWRSQDQKD